MKKILLTLVGVICSLGMWADAITIFDASASDWSSATLTSETTTVGDATWYGRSSASIATGSKTFSDNVGWDARLKFGGASTFKSGKSLAGVITFTPTSAGTVKVYCVGGGAGTRTTYISQSISETDKDTETALSGTTGQSVEQALAIATATVEANKLVYVWADNNVGIYGITFEASNKNSCDLAVASATVSVDYSATANVTYTTSSTGAISVKSSNENVATATVNATNKEVTISALAIGTATITVSQEADDNYSGGQKNITVTVVDPSIVYNWNTVGTTTLEGATADQVKIKNVKTDGIKFGSTLSATNYAKIESKNGGFKAGSIINWTGCINNKDANKDGAIMIVTAVDGTGFTVLDASDKFNNTNTSSVEASTGSFMIPYDVDALYIGRTNKNGYLSSPTATWLTELKVNRPVEGQTPATHAITVQAENGTVALPANAAIEDAKIYVKTTPNDGYTLKSLKANDEDITETKSFTMPTEDVTVTAEFKLKTTSITLGTNGYSTFASEFPYTIDGATAYKAVYDETTSKITLEAINVIPAGAGVVLKGNQGDKATATYSFENAADMTSNALKGVTSSITEFEAGTNYVLASNGTETAFVQMASGKTVTDMVGKAYLNVPSSGAKSIINIDAVTAISTINTNMEAGNVAYNLAGQRVSTNAKGITIINGKKFINK